MPSTSWFGTNISYEFVRIGPEDRQGEMTNMDFGSWRELKREVNRVLKEFTCPSCGRQKISGSGIKVRVGKVHLYKQIATQGWLGGVKNKEKFDRTVWRVHDLVLHTAPGRHVFNFFAVLDAPPGELKCNARGCSWSDSGGREGTQTLGQFVNRVRS